VNDPKTVSLEDLVGEHVLDGVIYIASEDPSDGYRSCLDRVIVSPSAEMTNTFPPIRVLARKKEPGSCSDDTLELVDLVTGKVVMEVGTDNTDDYYPSFVSNFSPENMATNQTKVD
jgi:hypothetical protein